MKCILNNTELKDEICDVCCKNVMTCLRELKAENKQLKELLLPLANFDLTGVRGDTVYQRNETKIMVDDVIKAKELLKDIK